jgi:chromosome segregation ATPase
MALAMLRSACNPSVALLLSLLGAFAPGFTAVASASELGEQPKPKPLEQLGPHKELLVGSHWQQPLEESADVAVVAAQPPSVERSEERLVEFQTELEQQLEDQGKGSHSQAVRDKVSEFSLIATEIRDLERDLEQRRVANSQQLYEVKLQQRQLDARLQQVVQQAKQEIWAVKEEEKRKEAKAAQELSELRQEEKTKEAEAAEELSKLRQQVAAQRDEIEKVRMEAKQQAAEDEQRLKVANSRLKKRDEYLHRSLALLRGAGDRAASMRGALEAQFSQQNALSTLRDYSSMSTPQYPEAVVR